MNKENNRSAAGLRRSALAERIRLREEWSELKGTSDAPLTASNRRVPGNNLMKKVLNSNSRQKPSHYQSDRINNTRQPCSVRPGTSEVLMGVVALVDVGAEPRALALRAALTALGATVVPAWTPIVTHVVWTQGGCRATRAKARALASRLVSPLWVEACAAANARLPEQTFPAAARASDLPSPRTLRQLLKKAEQENIPLIDLLADKDDGDAKPRLRISTDSERDTSRDTSHDTSRDTSHDTSRDTSHDKTESRVNTAPRRALPASTSPLVPRAAKSKRKLFTNREALDATGSGDETVVPATGRPVPNRPIVPKPTHHKRDLARAERMAKRLVAACLPAPTPSAGAAAVPRIVLTGMGKSERQAVAEAIKHLNGRIQSHVTRKTTHVLLGSCKDTGPCSGIPAVDTVRRSPRNAGRSPMKSRNEFNISGISTVEPRVVHRSDIQQARTLNALLGAARGCKVLTAHWALDCAREGKWLHHYGYEVPHLRKMSQKARIERTALNRMRSEYAYDVFNGMRVHVTSRAHHAPAAIQLLKLCGAITQDGSQHGGTQNGDCDVTVGEGDGEVSSKWVFDSVAAGRMRTTRRYVNNPLSNTLMTQTTDR